MEVKAKAREGVKHLPPHQNIDLCVIWFNDLGLPTQMASSGMLHSEGDSSITAAGSVGVWHIQGARLTAI